VYSLFKNTIRWHGFAHLYEETMTMTLTVVLHTEELKFETHDDNCWSRLPLCSSVDFQPMSAGMQCRASSGGCDLEEYCDGQSPECPSDVYLQDGEQCTIDGVSDVTGVINHLRNYEYRLELRKIYTLILGF
jgi:hypothetical protein